MERIELLENAKPILFNTEMVRAILEGRKTQTRRLVKPQPNKRLNYIIAGYGHGKWYEECSSIKGKLWTPPFHADDILYVRETWCSAYDGEEYFYFADKCTDREQTKLLDYDDVRWRPSIHMPKDAARIFLKVMSVKVERLQEITEEDARKEGIKHGPLFEGNDFEITALSRFPRLWNSTINKQDVDKYEWAANPYVWVIRFEILEVEE